VRWDLLGVAASNWFGKFASVPLPPFLRATVCWMYGAMVGVNWDEIRAPLRTFRSLQEFFTRQLKVRIAAVLRCMDGRASMSCHSWRSVPRRLCAPLGVASAHSRVRWSRIALYVICLRSHAAATPSARQDGVRPIAPNPLVSPVDGRVVVCGRVDGDRVEQVKGVTYSLTQFLGEMHVTVEDGEVPPDADAAEPAAPQQPSTIQPKEGNALFHIVIYLAPGDYHRLHWPCSMKVKRSRHFPGTLFPISPVVARLIPNLFALNERVVVSGAWPAGFFSFTAVGAYNVGSIALNFDADVVTNRFRKKGLRQALTNPNLEFLSFGGVRCVCCCLTFVGGSRSPVPVRRSAATPTTASTAKAMSRP
jgi:phosphatidylserine decarboxylase precursor